MKIVSNSATSSTETPSLKPYPSD